MQNFFNNILGVPLGWIIFAAYQLTNSFAAAVLIFSVVARIILFPIMLLAHKNSLRLLTLQPQIERLKRQYSGDREGLSEAQYNLFKSERYSPLVGLIPLFMQLFFVVGILQVMYHPLQHVLRLDAEIIALLTQYAHDFHGIAPGFASQLSVLELMRQPQNLYALEQALASLANADISQIAAAISGIDMNFLGLNLGEIPSFAQPILLIIPLLSGVSALAFCMFQNVFSPGALSQTAKTNWSLTAFTVAFSVYFAWVTPASVGVYWIMGNLLSIVVILILERFLSPRKLAGAALQYLSTIKKSPEQLRHEKEQKKMFAAKEKQDTAKWNAAHKKLVFYALSSGQYKYYKNVIEYILLNSDVEIHYLTNDFADSVFVRTPNPAEKGKITPYYASQQKTISLLLKLDADIMVTTVQDLQVYHMKKSFVRNDIEYVHLPHGPASLHLTAREASYDHFDTFFCVGKHQIAELRRREELAKLPPKTLVKAGYGLHDYLVDNYKKLQANQTSQTSQKSPTENAKRQILVAPSWQADNILDICIEEMLESLLGNDWRIIVRPHPQYTRVFPERLTELQEKYAENIRNGELLFDLDFLDSSAIFLSDLVITDWSGIAFEFSFCTLKPSIFVDTPMKIMNPNYKDYNLDVLDISLRNKVGVSLEIGQVGEISQNVKHLLSHKDDFAQQISEVVAEYMYYPGRHGEAAGRYLLGKLGK
ncbi:MAG: YidC/Oxa1 family membrane protein insertase [Defluviitaleaceae bacterium]|nr:YidC/Oxa1 family membrane protein insertase [Defluviitaleaceae bacterium]